MAGSVRPSGTVPQRARLASAGRGGFSARRGFQRLRLFLPFGSAVASGAGARIFTEPPAFSTAATADFDAPQTENSTLALNSPSPSSLTPSLARRSSPALTSAAASTGAVGIELAGVDRRLHPAEIDLVELERERRVAEAALRQAPMQRHLAAFEALDAHAGARGLALAAAAAGLAHARADAAADAHALLARAGRSAIWLSFIARPRSFPPRRTRSRSRRYVNDRRPRAPGARPWRSCRASPACPAVRATRPILLSPSPISVSR